jgi:NDP-mannose synthase
MKAVVLAGGKGTRLAPFTRVFPKPMLPIGDKTILEILLGQMKRAGFNHVVLTVGHLAGLMRAFFQDGSQYDLDITYSFEAKPLGTAGPLAHVEGLTNTFLVCNGDVLTSLDLTDLIDFHRKMGGVCTIAMHKRNVQVDLGLIEANAEHKIISYTEKPTLHYEASMGIYIFEPEVLAYIPKDSYMDFPDLIKTLISNKEMVFGYSYDGYWRDLGNPEEYDQACADFQKMRNLFIPEAG